MLKITYDPINIGERIYYTCHTPLSMPLPKGEFVFCLSYKRGYLRKVFITLCQPVGQMYGWVLKLNSKHKMTQFCVFDYSPTRSAKEIIYYYCKQHRAYGMKWNAPIEPCFLVVASPFGDGIAMEFRPMDSDHKEVNNGEIKV